MGLRSRHYPTLAEAAADWYRSVYLPVVETIHASGILGRFPGRTEADLYLWIAENRAGLQIRYGVRDEAREAVDDFAQEHRVSPVWRWIRRLLYRIFPRSRISELPMPAEPDLSPPTRTSPSPPVQENEQSPHDWRAT
jgi:hypothetical protein